MVHSVIVYEDAGWQRLLPLVYMRATFQLVCGMGSLLSKVRRLKDAAVTEESAGAPPGPRQPLPVWCRPELADLVVEKTGLLVNRPLAGETLLLNGRGLWSKLPAVQPGESSWVGTAGTKEQMACLFADAGLAPNLSPALLLDEGQTRALLSRLPRRDISDAVKLFDWPWELVLANKQALVDDWRHVAGQAGVHGQVAEGSYLLGRESVYIGPGTKIKPCVVIDAEDGPVWIGSNVRIMPHSYVQGPTYIGDGTLLQPGAVVHEGTFLGPVCKVGGEIETSIIQEYSNKQHDGFLGHSYVGAWVNIAADCINSDLKNTYGTVRVPINGQEVETGEMFVGTFIGDHSKVGINVSIPTGGVIGFCSSVFASRSPKYVPSFTWIEGETVERYDAQRGLAVARKVMARRKKVMSATEEHVFLAIAWQAPSIEHQKEE